MKLTKREAVRSAVMGFIATIITAVITSLNNQQLPTWEEMKLALMAGGVMLLTAVLKYIGTDTVESAKKDIEAQVPEGSEIVVKGEKKIN